jgi:CDGSH-type Zn-finger protein/uncharacterized Fe-S cluster protein YjdI
MDEKLRQYHGEKIEVTWSDIRCIHAAECLRRLGVVFDTRRKPWILPDAASADQVAETITHCPSGALHYMRKDSGPGEVPDAINSISPDPDGPLYVRGDIVIETPDGEILLKETRLALCRCGSSRNKPFCDNSHEMVGFEHDGLLGENKLKNEERLAQTGSFKIIPSRNGPYQLRGPVELHGSDGKVYRGNRVRLCRCGKSSNKPFCDDTHMRIGFKTE